MKLIGSLISFVTVGVVGFFNSMPIVYYNSMREGR